MSLKDGQQQTTWQKQTPIFLFITTNADQSKGLDGKNYTDKKTNIQKEHFTVLSQTSPHSQTVTAISLLPVYFMSSDRREYFSLWDSLHSSPAARPIYSQRPEPILMASTSRNGLLRAVSPQKSLPEWEHGRYLLIQIIPAWQTALLPNTRDVCDISMRVSLPTKIKSSPTSSQWENLQWSITQRPLSHHNTSVQLRLQNLLRDSTKNKTEQQYRTLWLIKYYWWHTEIIPAQSSKPWKPGLFQKCESLNSSSLR